MSPTIPEPLPGEDEAQDQPEAALDANPYGENNVDLPDELVNALTELVRIRQNNEQFVRRREVLRDRRNRYYERGFQHLHENERTGTFVQMQAGQSYTNASGQQSWCPNYIDDYNLFAPCLEILIAILTQNPPGIDFRPINPNLTEHMDASTAAEGYRKMFDRTNDPKMLQTEIVRMMGCSGRTVIWTRTEADAQRWGYDDEGNPHKMETATVYGTLESRVPVLAKSQSDCGFVVLFDDPDVTQARAKYPEFKDEIMPNMAGLGESAYERMARLGVLQGTRLLAQMGDSFNHLCTRSHVWLRPSEFEADSLKDGFRGFQSSDVGEDGKIPTLGEKLKQIFPSGCHVTFIGDKYVGSWDESMDDHLTIGFPLPGDGMSRQAIMDRAVVFQDRYNDDRNAYAECKDMGWPSTHVNADETEFDAIVQQKADPYAFRPFKARTGQPLEDEFFREPDPMLPNSFTADTEELVQMLYFVLGTPPAVFGEGETDQRTAQGFAQMKAQALGRLGLIWGAIQGMMAKMYYQAALCAASNPDHEDQVTLPGDGNEIITVSLGNIRKGHFGAYPDEDSSFPESTTAKRATMQGLVMMAAQSPIGASMFEEPDNWEFINQTMGLPELVLPQAQARDKQQWEIEELLREVPIPPDPAAVEEWQVQHAAAEVAAQAGAPPVPPMPPPQPKSSVPVGELDYHQYEFEKCQSFLSSEPCRKQLQAGNKEGVQNVFLHAKEHQAFMAMQAASMMQAAAPPAPAQAPHSPPKVHKVAASAPPGAPAPPAGPNAPGGQAAAA